MKKEKKFASLSICIFLLLLLLPINSIIAATITVTTTQTITSTTTSTVYSPTTTTITSYYTTSTITSTRTFYATRTDYIPTTTTATATFYFDLANPNRIKVTANWIKGQEDIYIQGKTAFIEALYSDDANRIYTDTNAEAAWALATTLEYFIETNGKPNSQWDDRIKIPLNFILDSKTGSSLNDFYHYYDLSNDSWQEHPDEDLFDWNARIACALSLIAAKMRFSPIVDMIDQKEIAYYDSIKNLVAYCIQTWRPIADPDANGSWLFSYVGDEEEWNSNYDNISQDTQIRENAMILVSYVMLAYYESKMNDNAKANEYSIWAQKIAQWLIDRQEKDSSRIWPEGGGYGGFSQSSESDSQYLDANAWVAFALSLYGLHIESIVLNPSPSKNDIQEVLQRWVEGFAKRTHDEKWGPIEVAEPSIIGDYPKDTWQGAAMGVAILGGYNNLDDEGMRALYYEWSENFYKWFTGNSDSGDLHRIHNSAGTGFYVGFDDYEILINDSNLETNCWTLLHMISLEDPLLVYNQGNPPPSPPAPGNCFIATALYGSPLATEVQFLKHVRDETIVNILGQEFRDDLNTLYYTFSPEVAQFIRENSRIRFPMIVIITPILNFLHYIDGIITIIYQLL